MYVVPRYTEISHFRAPYKDSLLGLGALFSTSATTTSATATAAPTPTTRPAYTVSSGTVQPVQTSGPTAAEAAAFATNFQSGMAAYWDAKNYDAAKAVDALMNSLRTEAVARYRADNGISPWQDLPPGWPSLVYQDTIAIDPNSNWRKQLRIEAKKAFGYDQLTGRDDGNYLLKSIASKLYAQNMANPGAIPGGVDKIQELDWRLTTEEANNARAELLRDQQMQRTTVTSPVRTTATVRPSGTMATQPPGPSQAPPVPAPPIIEDQYGPPGPGPATAGIAGALPWVAAAGVAGAVIWYAVKKKS